MTQFGVSPRTSGPLWKKLEGRSRSDLALTARVVARAIVEAARFKGEDPILCASGRYHVLARYTAFWALRDLFPSLPGESVARLVGAKRAEAFAKKALGGRGEFYFWSEAEIDAVKSAVRRESAIGIGASVAAVAGAAS